MEVDALSIIRSLPEFQGEITGVVPLFGGRCFDITLRSVESATRLASTGFDYESTIRPLRLLGAKRIHVSVFLPVEYPDMDLINLLKRYGQLKSENLRRLFYTEPGFTHIERGIRVAEFTKIDRDMPRKLVIGGVELHFKYTGQPMACYQCGSNEHLVQACPKPPRNRTDNNARADNNNATTSQNAETIVADMDIAETPKSQENTDSTTQDSPATETPSYAAITQSEVTKGYRKRRPRSPPADDNPTAKKPTTSEKTPTFLQVFLHALKEKGTNRTKLIQKVDGDRFYSLRSLYLQHELGDITKIDSRALGRLNVNAKEKEKWRTLLGVIPQDAYARLLTGYEEIRKAQPDLCSTLTLCLS